MIEVLNNSTQGCFESTDSLYIKKMYILKNRQLVARNLLNYEEDGNTFMIEKWLLYTKRNICQETFCIML